MCISSSERTGGQVSSGPAGVQRYSAPGEGSTFSAGDIHSHIFCAEEVQQGT